MEIVLFVSQCDQETIARRGTKTKTIRPESFIVLSLGLDTRKGSAEDTSPNFVRFASIYSAQFHFHCLRHLGTREEPDAALPIWKVYPFAHVCNTNEETRPPFIVPAFWSERTTVSDVQYSFLSLYPRKIIPNVSAAAS